MRYLQDGSKDNVQTTLSNQEERKLHTGWQSESRSSQYNCTVTIMQRKYNKKYKKMYFKKLNRNTKYK